MNEARFSGRPFHNRATQPASRDAPCSPALHEPALATTPAPSCAAGHPVRELPAELKEPESRVLLFCPEQGGWHTGEWWRVSGAARPATEALEPTHFALLPEEPAA
jgi:hypothetical protein